MIPISLVTVEHAISNFNVDIPEMQHDLRVACWNATQIWMKHIKMPDVTDIPSTWLYDALPAGFPLDEDFVPRLPATYSTESPQVEKYVIVPGELLAVIMLTAGEFFQNREASASNIPDNVVAMLDSFDVYTLV